jgi:hypothetical protein
MLEPKPIIVYHIASMGHWQDVVREQLGLLKEAGLDDIRVTQVGDGTEWLLRAFAEHDLRMTLVQADQNIMHYETFALLEIERLAKVENVVCPILYLHTKGVSDPGHRGKQAWRRAMNEHVVRRWRENMRHLKNGYDAVGVGWMQHGEQHFSGNFWMANPDWIRRLPDYVGYHSAKNFVRYSCEMWIGAQQWCRAYSLVWADQPLWEWDEYQFDAAFDNRSPTCFRNSLLNSRDSLGRWLNYHDLTGEGVEVGVDEGHFAACVLNDWKGKKLHLVDSWESTAEPHNATTDRHQLEFDKLADKVRERFSWQIANGTVQVHRQPSIHAAASFGDGTLDWVYLDGDHSYQGVAADIRVWWPKLRDGGVLLGHDYLDGKHFNCWFGVKTAVDAWSHVNGLRVFTTCDDGPAISWYIWKSIGSKADKVTVISGFVPPGHGLDAEVMANHQRYAQRQGYTYIPIEGPFDPSRSPCHSKHPIIRDSLSRVEPGEWIVWVDTDVVFLDPQCQIHQMLGSRFDAVAGAYWIHDQLTPNGGILAFRSCDRATHWLADAWRGMPQKYWADHLPGDELALRLVLDRSDARGWLTIPMSQFGSQPELGWQENPQVVHITSYHTKLRKAILRDCLAIARSKGL